MPVTGERAGHLLDALSGAFRLLGLDEATDHDKVFEHLVLARLVSDGRKVAQ